MKEFKTINDILDFAINAEQEAVEFYTKLSEMTKSSDMQQVFTHFAGEEISHKARLMNIKQSGIITMSDEKVADLKIADYTVSVRPSPEMSYADALVLAMSKEKAAFKLYTALAQRTSDNDIKNLFLMLAQEESKHKLQFELEYDDIVLREN